MSHDFRRMRSFASKPIAELEDLHLETEAGSWVGARSHDEMKAIRTVVRLRRIPFLSAWKEEAGGAKAMIASQAENVAERNQKRMGSRAREGSSYKTNSRCRAPVEAFGLDLRPLAFDLRLPFAFQRNQGRPLSISIFHFRFSISGDRIRLFTEGGTRLMAMRHTSPSSDLGRKSIFLNQGVES